MTARRSMALLAGLLGALILALLLGLMFLSGTRRAPDLDRGSVARPASRPPGKGSPESAPAGASPAPDPAGSLPAAPAAPPGSFRLEGSALFEDGSPCPGAHFLEMVRAEDGALDADLGSDLDIGVETRADGTFALSWAAKPASILLLVMSDRAEVASVENGSVAGPHEHGTVVEAAGEGPLRLRVRWKAGSGLVRAVDPATGTAYPRPSPGTRFEQGPGGLQLRWRLPDGETESAQRSTGGIPDGWLFVGAPRTVDRGKPPVLEAVVEGFATARVPLDSMRGRVELALRPLVPELLGELAVPGARGTELTLNWSLVPASGSEGPPVEMRGSIEGPGPFAFSEVPDGRWTLEIWALTPDGVRWARRTFEKSGAPVNLGILAATEWAGFRVRILDADGRPARFPLDLARESGGPTPANDVMRGRVRLRAGRIWFAGSGVVHLSQDDGDGDPADDPPVPVPGAGDVTEIRDLLPGTRYRLSLPDPPGTSVVAETPSATGEFLPVEIRIPVRPVRCALRFTVKGGVPAQWGAWESPRLPSAGWDGQGTFRATVFPGTYEVRISARTTETGWREFSGTVAIPAGEVHEETVDLR